MPPTFYLLHGPDEFAGTEFLDELKAKMGDPSLASFNTTVLDGRTASLPDVRAICDTLPFLTARRLVIVEGWLTRLVGKAEAADAAEADDEADDAAGSAAAPQPQRGGGPKETLKELATYLPNLPESTALVLVEKRELPKGNVVLKTASGAGWAFVKLFDLPKGKELVEWIRKRAKKEGGDFSREAAQALADVENDPRGLGNEIDKLLTYVDRARPVELDDVEALTPAGGEAIIWDVVDAIGQRRGPQAMRGLHKLLESAEPLYVLSMIVRQYRLLLLVKEQLVARAGEADIARTLGQKPYTVGKIAAQARHYELDGLERIYRRLLDYDVDIKTGQMEASAALDTLVGALTA
jgi:DNA polymerase III subunit delta